MASPLPVEPVGKGARWDVMTSVKSAGIVIDQTSTMTLKDVSGSDLELAVSLVQKAARQTLDLPQLPPGAVAELTGLKSEGSGSTKVSLNSVLPTESTMSMNTDQELRVAESAQAEPQMMKQKVKVEMSVKRGAAEAPAAGSAPKETPAETPKK
jgi:hypothetical protein